MSQPLQIGEIVPTQETRMGRMLAAGRLTATMRSKRSSQHITVTLSCKAKIEGKWKNACFAETTHCFIQYGQGGFGSTKVGTFYPKTGKLYFDSCDAAWQFAAKHTLLAAHLGAQDTDLFEIMESDQCGRCGRALTDPESILRGLGPECAQMETGSVHYKQDASNLIEEQRADGTIAVSRKVEGLETPVFVALVEQTDRKGRNVPRTFAALAAAVNG